VSEEALSRDRRESRDRRKDGTDTVKGRRTNADRRQLAGVIVYFIRSAG
jgi:hypothetical protein